jgi:cyclopropane fatty-acyl-phospholipid synthase-like methyltransferase
MGLAKLVMGKFYRQAHGQPEKLPWHQDEPPRLLIDAVRAAGNSSRALDIGCGAGVFSVWMAQQGMDVTGLDLFPEAIAMARARANEKGVNVTWVTGDLFEYVPPQPFDLVFDSGCLHALVGGSVPAYKKKLLDWLTARGTFVLGHWGKRHAFDWRPIGPRRRSEETIQNLFAPELKLREKDVVDFETPLPFGPVVRGVGYWFLRA